MNAVGRRELRHFGMIMGAMIAAVFGLVLPWIWGGQYRVWPWWLGAVLVGLAVVWPASLKWPYHAWMKIGGVLGRINTALILGLAYFAIFVPLGLSLRVLGKDTLSKGWRENVQSYRRVMPSRPASHMERQF